MKKHLFIVFTSILITQIAHAQISIGSLPYTYNQNFDSYLGSAATLPAGWSTVGGCAYRGTSNGGGSAGGYWAWGNSGEYNLGVLASGTCPNPGYTVSFQNNSGVTITDLTISYNFDQWRYASGNSNGFTVTETGISASVTGLNQSSNPTGTNGIPTVTPKSITLTGLNITPSSTFTLTFTTSDGAGSDNGFGIDDFSLTATGVATPPCTEPSTQPTALSLTPASYSVNGSFTASPTANGYLVVASTSPTLGAVPADGTPYSVGSPIGSGIVVYNGTSTSFTATGLSPSTTYYFFVFAYNSGGSCTINYLTTSPLTNNTTTLAAPVGTTLYPGDMVFVAYDNLVNAINSGTDYLAMTNLVDLAPGTKFLVANCTYETGAKPGGLVRTNTWHTCSATPTGNVPYIEITYTGTSTLPAGSIICFISPNGSDGFISIIAKGSFGTSSDFSWILRNASGGSINSGLINVSTTDPDALFLMQGSFVYNPAGSTFNGRVLAGIQDGGVWYEFTDDLTSLTGSALRISRKHPDIECFSIQAATSPAVHGARYNFSTKTGSQHVLLSNIVNFATNWVVYSPGNASYVDWGNAGVGDVNDPNCIAHSCACPKDYLNVTSFAIDGQWVGNVNTDWFNCRNWDNLQVPNQSVNVVIPPSALNDCHVDRTSPNAGKYGYVAKCNNLTLNGRILEIDKLADTLEVFGNLTINGGTLDMNDGNPASIDGLILLRGNWTNNASNAAFDEGLRSRVHFVGSAMQNINAAQPETFGRIVLDNANGLTLNQITQVQEFFRFENGKVFNNGTNYLDIMPFDPNPVTGGIQNYNANRYVVGKLRREVINGQIYDFPVGSNMHYQLATITFGASPLGINELDASFSTTIGGTPPNLIEAFYHYTTMADGGIWTIEPASGTFSGSYDITLNLNGSSNAASNCIVVKRNDVSSTWKKPGTPAGCTNAATLISSRNGLTSFSDFGIAVSTTLPVEWLDFSGLLLPNLQVQLNWATASELLNSHFNIQRSLDGVRFENIGKVNGKGTTNEIYQYQFVDEKPSFGRNYYRLEQVDLNGATHYSSIVEVFVQPSNTPLMVYPNPAQDNIHFMLSGTSAQLQIYDVAGKLVYETAFENQTQVSLINFPAGYYTYKIQNESLNLVGKFVKQ